MKTHSRRYLLHYFLRPNAPEKYTLRVHAYDAKDALVQAELELKGYSPKPTITRIEADPGSSDCAAPARRHSADRSCCKPVKVRLQHDLYNRLRGRPYYFSDDYAREIAAHEGEEVVALHTFLGSANDPRYHAAYAIEIGEKVYNLPALYVDRVE